MEGLGIESQLSLSQQWAEKKMQPVWTQQHLGMLFSFMLLWYVSKTLLALFRATALTPGCD